MWGYYDGYTAAQIELITADKPIIVYPKEKGKKKGEPEKANSADVTKAAEKWKEKYGDGGRGVKLDLTGLNLLGKK